MLCTLTPLKFSVCFLRDFGDSQSYFCISNIHVSKAFAYLAIWKQYIGVLRKCKEPHNLWIKNKNQKTSTLSNNFLLLFDFLHILFLSWFSKDHPLLSKMTGVSKFSLLLCMLFVDNPEGGRVAQSTGTSFLKHDI